MHAAEARFIPLRGAQAALAVVCALPVLPRLRAAGAGAGAAGLAGGGACRGRAADGALRRLGLDFKLAGMAALLATGVALLLGFALRLRERCPAPGGACGLARLCGAGRGDRGGNHLLPVGWLQERFPHWGSAAT